MPRPAALPIFLALALIASAAGAATAPIPAPPTETITFGRFGPVAIYRESPTPARTVLFVSGDGGWNLGVVGMARALARRDALVVGIDVTRYLKALRRGSVRCSYPAADLEALSQYVQKRLALPRYTPPILVGYSSGATLVYAALAQAPAGTFRGAISLGFCPDLPLDRPFCRGAGLEGDPLPRGKGWSFRPARRLSAPWVALQGEIDRVCDPKATARFVSGVGGGELVSLPHVGHGFSVERNWLPQLEAAFERLAAPPAAPRRERPPAVADLPLVEVLATHGASDLLAVVFSGDGGWAGLDRAVAGILADHGIPVVGISSLEYFWTPRTPDGAAADLARVLRHYLAAWDKEGAILVGYSRGADTLPFLAARLPPDLLSRVRLVALLAPARTASFQFHLADWLGGGEEGLPTAPAVAALRGLPVLCLYGDLEENSLCPTLPRSQAKVEALPGSHHFEGAFAELGRRILLAAGESRGPGHAKD